jgi:hypothetical protein
MAISGFFGFYGVFGLATVRGERQSTRAFDGRQGLQRRDNVDQGT